MCVCVLLCGCKCVCEWEDVNKPMPRRMNKQDRQRTTNRRAIQSAEVVQTKTGRTVNGWVRPGLWGQEGCGQRSKGGTRPKRVGGHRRELGIRGTNCFIHTCALRRYVRVLGFISLPKKERTRGREGKTGEPENEGMNNEQKERGETNRRKGEPSQSVTSGTREGMETVGKGAPLPGGV